jgi:hypothetical protein
VIDRRVGVLGVALGMLACGNERTPTRAPASGAAPAVPATAEAAGVRFEPGPALPDEFRTELEVDGDTMLAVASWHDARGATTALLRSGDGGTTWQRLAAPPAIRAADVGHGAILALTSDALHISRDAGITWRRVELPALDPVAGLAVYPPLPQYNSVLATADGALVIGWNALVAVQGGEARVLATAPELRPGELFVRAARLPGGDLLITTNPFGLVRWSSAAGTLARWDDGLTASPPGHAGPLHVAIADDVVVGGLDGMYRRPVDGGAWSPVPASIARMVRGMAPSPWTPGALIVAPGMKDIVEIPPGGAPRTVWREGAAPTLVAGVTATADAIVVGFIRATPEAAGLVLRDGGRDARILALPR